MTSSRYMRVSSSGSNDLPVLPATFAADTYDDLLAESSRSEQPSPSATISGRRTPSRGSIGSFQSSDAVSIHSSPGSRNLQLPTHGHSNSDALMSGALPFNEASNDTQSLSGSSSSSLYLQPQHESRPLISPRKLSTEERIKLSISPSAHASAERLSYFMEKHKEDDLDKTARIYGSWIQAKRLWRLAALEWLVTAVLCGAFAGVLASYSKRHTLRTTKVLQVNSILTVLTFLLGVNLASSMRSYAKLLRWRLLARDYQPLEIFDLVLRCESLLNVCKLIWHVKIHKKRSFRWKTRAFCMIWLLANVALTLFVGMIGLTYSLDPQGEYYVTDEGMINITDFSALKQDNVNKGLKNMQNWGSRGFLVECDVGHAPLHTERPCRTRRTGVAYYRLRAWSPADYAIQGLSDVRVYSNTTCEVADVIEGGNGRSKNITYTMDGVEQTYPIVDDEEDLPGPDGLLVASKRCDNCTDRSIEMRIFAPGRGSNATGQMFFCQNRVGDSVKEITSPDGEWWIVKASEEYQMTDYVARMFAGALGWSGIDADNYGNTRSRWSRMTYNSISEIGEAWRDKYGSKASTANMSDFVSTFTMKAMFALDMAPSHYRTSKQAMGRVPKYPQVLIVDWKWASLLLVGIPMLQLIACIMVFFIANRAVIKDDSPLAMAKLYWSLLEKYGLGRKGCIMRGGEIVDYIKDQADHVPGGPSVIYGWKYMGQMDIYGNRVGHVDVFEEENHTIRPTTPTSMTKPIRSPLMGHFEDGIRYNGTSNGSGTGIDQLAPSMRNRTRRLSF